MDFIHLHVHNEYSQLDGLGKAEVYAAEAVRLGFSHLALTNHANVDGNIKFQLACLKAGIKPIHGCELYLVDNLRIKNKGERRYHIVALVREQQGWENLLRMLTIANIEGFYWRPRVDPKTLMEHSEGLVFMTACADSFIHADWGAQLLKSLGDRVYLEIMPHDTEDQKRTNALALQLSKKFGLPLVATNDCHYPTASGAKSQEVLLAIQSKAKWNDPKRWRFDVDGLYLKTKNEMKMAFKKQGIVADRDVDSALEKTLEVAALCENFSIQRIPVNLPKVPGYEDRDETELLRELVWKGFKERVLDKGKGEGKKSVYRRRINEELELICELGFQRYFLIVWELVNWCKKSGIMVGPGRGSAGGSLVVYLLYITDVDPIEHRLLFSRFISPARIDLPDIDLDFEDIKRPQIRAHLEECYGKENVVGLSTFFTLKGRAALRDVARVFDIPVADVDAAAKSIVTRSKGDFRSDSCIEDAFDVFEDGIRFKKKYPEVTRIAMELEGQVRGSGQHAAAMCVSAEELSLGKRCNLCVRNGVVVANWDKEDAEYVGLMKLDILGLSALTVLNQTRIMVKRNKGVDLVFSEIPLDDKLVYSEISKGHTVGAFQIGSMGISNYCRELGVENFDMLVHATSLWRPGTLRAGLVTEFLERKKGKPYSGVHPLVDELTKDTFGIILYQEQVMLLMHELAGLGWKTCDTVRKVISKSQGEELFLKFKEQFVEGCKRKGTLNEQEAGKVWDTLATFGSYGFNRSHAVEYSMITYWDMYCKVYYPAEFMACSLTYGSEAKKAEYVDEARRLGLSVKLPKIGVSDSCCWEAVGRELYAPFTEIKGVGEKTALAFQKAGKTSDGFFKARGTRINKKIWSLLELMDKSNEGKASEEEAEYLQSFFQFDIFSDPLGRVRGIYELLRKRIVLIENLDFSKPSKDFKLFFGRLPEVRYGYKQTALKALKGGGQEGGDSANRHSVAGTADSLGGVCGFFRDMSKVASAMAIFNSSLYSRRKADVEHCEGKWMLVEANHPRRVAGKIFVERMATEEQLYNCDFDGIEVNLIESAVGFELKGLSDCNYCQLRRGCTEPVAPSLGKYNVMILGEAPGRVEDRMRMTFVGDAGEVLWQGLSKYGLKRELFNITNVVKCWPSKTPVKSFIETCAERWLTEEIKKSKPVLILALGNTPLHFLKGQESGITSLNGTTEWNRRVGAWVCWCVHPASVLYQGRDREAFELGLANFARCLSNLGLKTGRGKVMRG